MHSMEDDGSDLAEGLLTAFAGVDRIVACGDHVTGGALDRLAQLAPITATANPNSPGDGAHHALAVTQVLTVADKSYGILFSPRQLEATVDENDGAIIWPADLAAQAEKVFGRPVAGVLFGGTHYPLIDTHDGLALVNPGSPRFAHRTTAAIVEIDDATGTLTAEIIDV